jgi:diguanylate cyclase (GGDEF)-like protein/PAS domain S-box-containing protein
VTQPGTPDPADRTGDGHAGAWPGGVDPAATVPEGLLALRPAARPPARPPAVVRTDLRRAHQALLNPGGTGDHRFASQIARAVSGTPARSPAAPSTPAAGRAVPATVVPSGDPGHGAQAAAPVLTSPAPAAPPAPPPSGPPPSGPPPSADPEPLTDPYPVPPMMMLDRPSDESPDGLTPGTAVLPALRDAVFGHSPMGAESLPLPDVPAAVCDRSGRIVRANPALLQLAGMPELFGRRLVQLVVGADTDARLVRADGGLVRVRVVRWEPAGQQLTVVGFVELDDSGAAALEHAADRTWTESLERLARVGTWSYELAARSLQRSETLDELYRSVGIDAETDAPEADLVTAFVESLRAGDAAEGRHVERHLPGDVHLSCRAEIEYGEDGVPVRVVGVVRDLSVQRAAADRARRAGQRFSDLMALLPGGVALLDAAGRVVEANAGLGAILDVAPEQLIGVSAPVLAADSPAGDAWPDWLRVVPPGAQYGYRVDAAPLRRGDGTTVWCELDVAVTIAADGDRYWLVVATDVTDRRRVAEVLRNAGTVDELTRLPNRAACLELLDRLLAGARRGNVAVVCGGLDGFQRINSSLGHDAGDDLLVGLAARLQRELPVGCTAARLSGDEFVVVCADHADIGGPDQLARLVAGLLRTTVPVCGRPVPVTASVGLATPVPTGEVRAADLLRFAEVAMHEVKKQQSPGGIGVATDGIVTSAARALEMEAELRAVLAADGLACVFQPVVGPDGTVQSLEALVRWPHPERGTIPPSDFLPIAQRCGLLRELDLWVLRTATAAAAQWPEHEGVRPAVAVNLAGLLPGDADFSEAVAEAVVGAGLAWDRLVLELVETSLVALPTDALAAMERLTDRGVRFAVDDFGTGYSSLARLKELPAQTIKVDRAFVTGVADDPVDFAVARAVVDMASAMGRTTVAEGVETAEQFHVLRGIGVDAYQGWLFSRPVAAGDVAGLLAGGRLETPAARRP